VTAPGERPPPAPPTAAAAPTRPPQTRVLSTRRRLDGGFEASSVVPRALQVSAALGWRLLVVVAALYVIGGAT
jgi:putative heme transporter